MAEQQNTPPPVETEQVDSFLNEELLSGINKSLDRRVADAAAKSPPPSQQAQAPAAPTQPVAPPVAEAPPEKKPLPAHLLEHAREYGIPDAEAEELGDGLAAHLSRLDRHAARQARQYQQHAPQQRQEAPRQAPEPPKEFDPYAGKRDAYDPETHALIDNLHGHYSAALKDLQSKVDHAYQWVASQQHDKGTQTINTVCDELHDLGYEELGKGNPRPGTQVYQNRDQMGYLMAQQWKALADAGIQPDVKRVAQSAAILLFGPRAAKAQAEAEAPPPPQPKAQEPPRRSDLPPRPYSPILDSKGKPHDPATGQFIKPTGTLPPTHRDGAEQYGRDAALTELKRHLSMNGIMKDIHE